jgi:phospholipase/carboxylesterase
MLKLGHLVAAPRQQPRVRPPVLFLLHGFGSNQEDLFNLAPEMDRRLLIISVQGPVKLDQIPGGYAWFDLQFNEKGGFQYNPKAAQEAMALISDFIPAACDEYRGNPDQVFLLGFSQGAVMCHALLPELAFSVAGIAGLSGKLPGGSSVSQWKELIPEKFPLFVSHGVHDDIIPVQNGREIRPSMSNCR